MSNSEDVERVLALLDAAGLSEDDYRNDVAARAALTIPFARPGRRTRNVHGPILFCVCEHDSVAPAAATLRHARRAPHGEIRTYPAGHFDIYTGELFEQVVGNQLDFLKRHVPTESR
jgi:pimeloyl-ACP methyl ester carboxylesterase